MTRAFHSLLLGFMLMLIAAPLHAEPGASSELVNFKLENGLRVILLPLPTSEITQASFVVPGSFARTSDAKAGLENLMTSLLPQGTERRTKEEVDRLLDSHGSSLSSEAGRDYSAFHLLTVKPFLPAMLDLFAESMLKPAFADKELENTRQAMLSEVRAKLDSPDAHLALDLNARSFVDHPYHADPDGSVESLSSFTRADVQAAHHEWLASSGAFLVVVGNLSRAELEGALTKAFAKASFAPADPAAPLRPPLLNPPVGELVRVDQDIPTRYIIARFVAPTPADPDFAPLALGMKVLRDRLWENVRTKGGLAYAVSSRLVPMFAGYGFLYVTTNDERAAMPRVWTEVTRLASEPIGEAELTAAKAVYTTEHYMGAQSASGLAGQLIFAELYMGGAANRRALVEAVRASTAAQVQAIAAKVLTRFHYGVLGRQDTLHPEVITR